MVKSAKSCIVWKKRKLPFFLCVKKKIVIMILISFVCAYKVSEALACIAINKLDYHKIFGPRRFGDIMGFFK